MCSAFAYIPHSLFWMDYLSGTLHFPLQQRNLFWVLYGVGSCVGAFVAYCLSRLIGYLQAIKCLYGVYCLAVALPFFHMLLLCSLYRPFLQVYSHLPPYLLALTACYRFMNSVIKNLEPCHHWVCQHSVIRWRCYYYFTSLALVLCPSVLMGGIVLLFALSLLIPIRSSLPNTLGETKS